MIDQIREAIRSASSMVEVPRKKAESIARDLARRGEGAAASVSSIAEEIVRRSRENAEAVRKMVASEVRSQIRLLGVATRDDLERLTKRVRELESKSRKSGGSRGASTVSRSGSKRARKS